MNAKEVKDALHTELDLQHMTFDQRRAAKAVADKLVDRVLKIVAQALREARREKVNGLSQ